MTAVEPACVAAAYGAGCLPSGWLLVRSLTGQDVRTLGSGSTGARNVGRVLGPSGFAATMTLDIAKGALAVGGARLAGCGRWAVAAAAVAVIAGHVWPAPLAFRGGKGVATAFGALLATDLGAVAVLFACFAAAWVAMRRTVLAALAAFAATPLAAWALGAAGDTLLVAAAAAVMVLVAHRDNLRAHLVAGRAAGGGAGGRGAPGSGEGNHVP